MADLPPEIHERILVRSSVRDLIRCKSVCKDWLTLISKSRFIKAHLNHSYFSDRYNNEIGDRRVHPSLFRGYFLLRPCSTDVRSFFNLSDYNLLGSSDGLVCIYRLSHVLVVNPSTREVKKIAKPIIPEPASPIGGFGYDSSMDDYKIVLGFKKNEKVTRFRVFSLRSNIWKVIGEVDYYFISTIGILFSGELHWVAYNTSKGESILLSFHLRDEKFLEVPLPDELAEIYNFQLHPATRLGIVKNCLCLFQEKVVFDKIWLMKDYNKKHSWEIVRHEYESKYHTVHGIKLMTNYIPNKTTSCYEPLLCQSPLLIGAPLYVESLVSPHFSWKRKRLRSTVMFPKVRLYDCIEALPDVTNAKDDTDDNASTS